MLIFRWLATLLILASALSFAFYLGTGKVQYKRFGFLLFKWTVIAALAFFAVMFVGRII
ncbi:hypothetical protein [Comamonas fluminis]|uniref:hypothetical protein n=1 Tax=Comamonas fluminis TaxID=2796366 RepID=UPI00191BDEEF|nr:hypothetical protein [Comamonas fluminis]